MIEFETFLKRLGGLHDAFVNLLIWIPEAQTLRFEIDDLYSNFEGLPEYPGAAPGTIELREVDRLEIAIDGREKELWIYDFQVESADRGQYKATVLFSPSGQITASYGLADFPQVDIPEEKS